jgi:hypothetical protein
MTGSLFSLVLLKMPFCKCGKSFKYLPKNY